jgi:hypothetical protein
LVKDFTIDEEIIKTIYRPRKSFLTKETLVNHILLREVMEKLEPVLATKRL